MKKTIYSSLAIAVLVGALAVQTASANENGGNNNRTHAGFFQNLGFKFFHGNDNNQNNNQDNNDNKQKEDNNMTADKETNDDNNSTSTQNPQSFKAGVAKVTAISGNQILATNVFGSPSRIWTINTTSTTTFSLRNGNSSTLGSILVGDVISFRGNLISNTNSNLTVDASSVKDWGVLDLTLKGKLTGTVTSVNNVNQSLVLQTNDNQTVTVNATGTTVVKNSNGTTTFSNINAGATVRVNGFWNSLKNIFTAFKIMVL